MVGVRRVKARVGICDASNRDRGWTFTQVGMVPPFLVQRPARVLTSRPDLQPLGSHVAFGPNCPWLESNWEGEICRPAASRWVLQLKV